MGVLLFSTLRFGGSRLGTSPLPLSASALRMPLANRAGASGGAGVVLLQDGASCRHRAGKGAERSPAGSQCGLRHLLDAPCKNARCRVGGLPYRAAALYRARAASLDRPQAGAVLAVLLREPLR